MTDNIPTNVPMTSNRKEELARRPFGQILPDAISKIKKNLCPACGRQIKESDFNDDLSRKEYNISGMCQACQDKVFG